MMKKFSALFALLLLFAGSPLFAQDAEPATTKADSVPDKRKRAEEGTQKQLETLLKYAAELKYDAFGKIMGYAGRDPNRNLRTAINPLDPHERIEIENNCNFLNKWLSKSALHHAKNFRAVKGAYGDLFFWNVEFTLLNGKSKEFVFMFIEVGGRYLFCSVDKA